MLRIMIRNNPNSYANDLFLSKLPLACYCNISMFPWSIDVNEMLSMSSFLPEIKWCLISALLQNIQPVVLLFMKCQKYTLNKIFKPTV